MVMYMSQCIMQVLQGWCSHTRHAHQISGSKARGCHNQCLYVITPERSGSSFIVVESTSDCSEREHSGLCG